VKWISVKTRKHDDTKAVLVWCPQRENMYAANWNQIERTWSVFGDGLRRDLERDQKVTRWTPLPDPPTEK
jgi:hypothetical protein